MHAKIVYFALKEGEDDGKALQLLVVKSAIELIIHIWGEKFGQIKYEMNVKTALFTGII